MIDSLSAMDKPIERPRGPLGLSRSTWAALAVAGALLGALILAVPSLRRWSRSDKSVDASRLRVAAVARGSLERDASAQGQIVAALHPTLFSPAQGFVALRVKAGAAVKAGHVLAQIESPELRSRLLQERATLLSLQSALSRQRIAARQGALRNRQTVDLLEVKRQAANRGLERAQRTFDEGLLNKTDYEKAKDDVAIASLELRNAREAAVLEAETADFDIRDRELQAQRQSAVAGELQRQVDRLAITSPFDGIVANVAVQDRDAVAANQAILTVVNLSKFEVEITLPENYSADAVPGTPALILYEGKDYPGRLTAISPEIKDSQVKGTVVFEGEPPSGLRQSQRVTSRLVFESKPDVLKLPRGPFLESGAGRVAYVVKDGLATRREIAVGVVSVSAVEIVSGLSEGESVVVSDISDFAGAGTILIRK